MFSAQSGAANLRPYPNELHGIRLYKRYLAPLRPAQSDEQQVKRVLGPNERLELKDWRILALFSCSVDCSHGNRNDPLYEIMVTPRHRVSMLVRKFPKTFRVSYGSVSEVNVACRIYADAFGLEYWVVSDDLGSYKKGDLFMIRYGIADGSQQASPLK